MYHETPQDVVVGAGIDPKLFGDGDFIQVRAALIAEVGAVEAIVLSRVYFRANESHRHAYERDGYWWWRASAPMISEETGLTEKQVKRALTLLRDAGHIVGEQHGVEGNYDRAMSYRVNLSPIGPAGPMDSPHRDDVHRPYRADVPLSKDIEDIRAFDEEPDALFDLLWDAWPNKKGRKPAAAKWAKFSAAKRRQVKPLLLAHAEAHGKYTPLRYVPMLSTWLNQERWSDPVPSDPDQALKPVNHQASKPMGYGQFYIPRGHRAIRDETGAIIGTEPKPGYGELA